MRRSEQIDIVLETLKNHMSKSEGLKNMFKFLKTDEEMKEVEAEKKALD